MPLFTSAALRTFALVILLASAFGLAPPPTACQERPPNEQSDDELAALVEKAIGEKPQVVRSQHFRMVTVFDPAEARRQLQLAEKAYAAIAELLCVEPDHRFWPGTMDEFRVTEKQFPAVIREVMPRYEPRKERSAFALAMRDGIGFSHCSGFKAHDPARDDDTIVNHVVVTVLALHAGEKGRLPAFLRQGLAHHFCAQLCGDIRIAWHSAGRRGTKPPPASPAKWAAQVERSVKDRTYIPFDKIKYVFPADIWENHHVQAWAFVTFLMSEHRAKFSRFLHRSRSMHWEHAYYKEFNWTGKEFDQHWVAWVKAGGMTQPQKPGGSHANRLSDEAFASLIEETIREKPTIARSEHFRLSLLHWEDHAQDWVQCAERAHADFARLVGDPARIRYWDGRADLLLTFRRAHVLNLLYCKQLSVGDKRNKYAVARDRHLGSRMTIRPPSAVANASIWPENFAIHFAARLVLRRGTEGCEPPPYWIDAAYGAAAEADHAGRVWVAFCVPFGVLGGWLKLRLKLQEQFPKTPRELAAKKTCRPMKELWRLTRDQTNFADHAQACSIYEFLRTEHRTALGQWLRLARIKPWAEAFHEAFGWDDREALERWTKWVLARTEAGKPVVPVGAEPTGK